MSAQPNRRRTIAYLVGSFALVAAMTAGIAVAATNNQSGVLSAVPTAEATPPSAASPSASTTQTPTPTGTETGTTAPTGTETGTGEPMQTTAPEPAYDYTTASAVTVLVNKRVPLDPADYQPEPLVNLRDLEVSSINDHSLREDAASAVKEMFAAAEADGHVLDMTSGYRGYALQTELYEGYVADMGQEAADLTSARPGYSEHQTGLSADISAPAAEPDCILAECFGDTAAGQWLAENAWQYGFILRYPEGETAVTGYDYEPWHFRFIGVDAAADYQESGAATYEEFLGVDPAPDYGG